MTAARQVSLKGALVVRLEGTNVDLGKKILAESVFHHLRFRHGGRGEKVVKAIKT